MKSIFSKLFYAITPTFPSILLNSYPYIPLHFYSSFLAACTFASAEVAIYHRVRVTSQATSVDAVLAEDTDQAVKHQVNNG